MILPPNVDTLDVSCSNTLMEPASSLRLEPTIKWRQHLTFDLPNTRPGCLWIHACSMGEINSIAPLVRKLLAEGQDVHLTVVTQTGFDQARRLFANSVSVSFLPWDLPGSMRRLLRRLQPRLLLLTETEFWPGMLSACKRNRVPVIGINTRISDRSFPRYMATRKLWQRWLAPVELFLAQSELDATRLASLGILKNHIRVVGNLKFAVQAPHAVADELRSRLDPSGKRPVLLVASTHDDEEKKLLSMMPDWRMIVPKLLIVLVPRHPERFESVALMIENAGLSMSRWSQSKSETADICLIDAMGLLSSLYTIADLVIIGGSIVPIGGHNPLEAAICGRGVITGPHIENFRDIMEQMQSAGAAVIASDDMEMDAIVRRFLSHPDDLRQLNAHAAEFMQDKSNVLDRIFEALNPYLRLPEKSS